MERQNSLNARMLQLQNTGKAKFHTLEHQRSPKSRTLERQKSSKSFRRQSSINYSSLTRQGQVRLHDEPLPAMAALWSEQRGVTLRTKPRPPVLSIDSGNCGTLPRGDTDDDGYLRASCTDACCTDGCGGGRCSSSAHTHMDTLRSTATSERTGTSTASMDENVFTFENEEQATANSSIDINSEVNLNVSMYDNIKMPLKGRKISLENQTYGLVLPTTPAISPHTIETIAQVHTPNEQRLLSGAQTPLADQKYVVQRARKNSMSSDTSSGFQSDFHETPRNSPKHRYVNEEPIIV